MDLHSNDPSQQFNNQFQPYSRRVEFSGNASEFFSIWIVNIVLTLLTLGIYSAWAKVRTYRYFYGHTQLDGHRFDYLATPIQILKGRILAFICFALYMFFVNFIPLLGILAVFVLMFLIPWIVNQGMRFNMRMSRYRNIRFNFQGSYGEAFVVFLLLPFLSVFTLYLLLPYVFKRIDQYLHSNIEFAGTPITVETRGGEYYLAALMAYVAAAIVGVVLLAVAGVFGFGLEALAQVDQSTEAAATVAGVVALVMISVVYMVALAVGTGIYQTHIRNHILNSSEIDGIVDFKSDLQMIDYTLLIFTNSLALVFSLGLAYPWTKVRKTRMLAQATEITILCDPQQLHDQLGEQDSSFAEEAAGMFDIDLSLG
ncbi:YjgN family protein [Pseudoalteromonas sp. YIC-656]|uniref:YjgN family protein n=1 Tax=Pseudoalteromonas pernae TaxID=3118054 RepID=UPI003242C43E